VLVAVQVEVMLAKEAVLVTEEINLRVHTLSLQDKPLQFMLVVLAAMEQVAKVVHPVVPGDPILILAVREVLVVMQDLMEVLVVEVAVVVQQPSILTEVS
jgi:hypothetical protein